MTTYVDASVVLRVVLREPGVLVTWGEDEMISSELVRVECLRTIDRARAAFNLSDTDIATQRASVLGALTGFALTPISVSVLERASDPFPTALGTLDAIHLATALRLREEYPTLSFATHDYELAVAARSMGFEVLGV